MLEGAIEPVQKHAMSLLRRKDVDILTEATVDNAEYETDSKTWEAQLSTGRVLTADAYIATTGTIPNNEFIPKSCLNSQGWVNADEQLKVVEDGISRSDTCAVRDITCHPYRLLSRVSLQGKTF